MEVTKELMFKIVFKTSKKRLNMWMWMMEKGIGGGGGGLKI
jgi:hypothetical protein